MESEHQSWVAAALKENEGPLLRYAFSLTRDLDAAKDIVQDTFLRMIEQRPETPQGRLAPWLFTVCRNRALDWLRKERRMTSLEESEDAEHQTTDTDPATVAEQNDSSAAIQRLMTGLPANQQEVVRLKFQSQLTYEEIAAVTQLSVGNVGFLLHTAIRTLRHQMTALEQTPST